MKNLVKLVFPFIVLLIISLPAIKDLFKPGAYTSHDLTHHIVRLIQMDKILKEGQIPPRWSGELNKGYGYPIFLFNYSSPYLLGEVFHLFGFNFIWSAKMVFVFSLVASIFFAFVFFRELWEDDLAGFLSAVFYLYAPIRFVNVYISATIGNALAFVFIPLPFWSILRIAKKKGNDLISILVGSLNLACLILSHNIIALMFVPALAVFTFVLFWQIKKFNFLKKSFFIFVVGLGIACFFWLPAVFEKKYIRYDEILPHFYQTYFPAFWQLIRSPWGYGFDHPGTENDAMPFQIGLTHILVVILTIFLLTFKRWICPRLKILRQFQGKIASFFLFFFFLSIFLIQRASIPVYEKIKWLQYVQHPWRFLALSVFCASALAGFLVASFKGRVKLIYFFGLLFLVLYANRNHLRINQVFDPGEDYYLAIDGTTTMAGEHLPRWGRQMKEKPASKIEFLKGSGEVYLTKVASAENNAVLKVFDENAVLKINHFYFPGWKLFIDNQEIRFDYLNKQAYGLPVFSLKTGEYQLKYILTRTITRLIADIISVISIFVCVILLIFIIRAKSRTKIKLASNFSTRDKPRARRVKAG